MALPLVEVVLVPLVIVEIPSSRLKVRGNRRSSKRLGVQFCDDPIGGNGKRLRPLTRKLASDDRPASSDAVLCGDTLFAQDSEFITFPILQGGNTQCVTIH